MFFFIILKEQEETTFFNHESRVLYQMYQITQNEDDSNDVSNVSIEDDSASSNEMKN